MNVASAARTDGSMVRRLFSTCLAVALAMVVLPVSAEPTPEPTPRAETIAFASHVTATKLRHRWDGARAHKDALAAGCLEPKVSEAMMLMSRVDLKRLELRDGNAAERAHAERALETLDARRKELEGESSACAPHVYTAIGGTRVTLTILRSIAAVEPGFGVSNEPELLRALLAVNTGR